MPPFRRRRSALLIAALAAIAAPVRADEISADCGARRSYLEQRLAASSDADAVLSRASGPSVRLVMLAESHRRRPVDLLVRALGGPLDREHEALGRLVAPPLVALRTLQRVEGPVDLDRREPARGVLELAAMREPLRVEDAPPRRISPARDADADRHDADISRWGTASKERRAGAYVNCLWSEADVH